jgi:hypothetical protein
MLPTGGTIMDDQQTQRVAQAPMTDDAIRSRIDELIAELTPAEKAGQLTQYFYFGSLPETDAEQIANRPPSEQATMVETVLGRGEAGSLLFVTDPAEINRLQRLTIEGHRLGIPALFGFDVIHGSARSSRCRSRWRRRGIQRRSSRASPSRRVRRGQ